MFAFRRQWRPAAALCALAAGLFTGIAAQAAVISHTGTFSADNELFTLAINLNSPTGGTISANTLSYNGGLNAAGNNIAAGGFAPVLVLFDSAGDEVYRNIGSSNSPASCSANTFCWDAVFNFATGIGGSYTLVLSQDENLPSDLNLADGYSQNSTDYTAGNGCAGGMFCQIDGAQRTGFWALDISVVPTETGTVPEPGSAGLLAAAAGAWALSRRRTASSAAPRR